MARETEVWARNLSILCFGLSLYSPSYCGQGANLLGEIRTTIVKEFLEDFRWAKHQYMAITASDEAVAAVPGADSSQPLPCHAGMGQPGPLALLVPSMTMPWGFLAEGSVYSFKSRALAEC